LYCVKIFARVSRLHLICIDVKTVAIKKFGRVGYLIVDFK